MIKPIATRHEKKLLKFRKLQQKSDIKSRIQVSKNTIHRFSSYTYNSINTELELFYQNVIRNISHIPEQNVAHVKIKLRNTCENYCKIKIPFKYREIIQKVIK